MADEPGNAVLAYLRRLDERLHPLIEDMREAKQRLGFLERQYASLSRRVDMLDQRVERIERRLGLIGSAA